MTPTKHTPYALRRLRVADDLSTPYMVANRCGSAADFPRFAACLMGGPLDRPEVEPIGGHIKADTMLRKGAACPNYLPSED